MKQFFILIILVFSGMFLSYLYRDDQLKNSSSRQLVVYAESSFVNSWGAGPALKDLFEKKNGVQLKLVDMGELSMAFEKMSLDKSSHVDVVIGLDQYDIVRNSDKIKWKKLEKNDALSNISGLESIFSNENFLPYDWAPLAFVGRKTDLQGIEIKSMSDLLKPDLKNQIALQDPRTSSPGLQFYSWVVENQYNANSFLAKISKQAHSYSSNWSSSYGLFKNKQAKLVFSYVTSPLFHLIEEKDDNYMALEFKEGHPVQVEFVGIPETCINCSEAREFVNFLFSVEAQKILMTKNYMFPILKLAKEGSVFESIKQYKILPFQWKTKDQINLLLNSWTDVPK